MRVTIVAVHPAITIIKHDAGQLEVPTLWFPKTPKVGQTWSVQFTHEPSEQEKLDTLNTYLVRD